MSSVYLILFIISVVYIIVLFTSFKNQVPIYYLLLFFAGLLTNFGNMQLVCADTLKMALFANQTIYLGAVGAVFFMLMCIADLCKFKIRKKVQVFYLVVYGLIFTMVSTVGVTDLYYKSVELVIVDGIASLHKTYGPLHAVYAVYLYGSLIPCSLVIIKSMWNRKNVSYKTSITLLVLMALTIGSYYLEKKLALPFSLVPFVYTASDAAILVLLRKIRLFDVTAMTTLTMLESDSYGFVICDSDGKFLGSDDTAKEWFPEINDIPISSKINPKDSSFLAKVCEWYASDTSNQVECYEVGNIIVEAKHIILSNKGKKSVHCVYLNDDTPQQKYTRLVAEYNENLQKDVKKKEKQLGKIQEDIIVSMASIVENRDNNTGGHIARTSDIVKIFVEHLMSEKVFSNLSDDVAVCITKAAPLHDFGKIAIPDVILNKPGKFTDEEYEQMKMHSEKGAVIVAKILQNVEDKQFKNIAINVAHYHHEKWNGTGYPSGLKAEEIPFEARVMALADVFDALVSKRVYKDSFSYDKAFSIIEESKNIHFDPLLCDEFLKCRSSLEALYDSYED